MSVPWSFPQTTTATSTSTTTSSPSTISTPPIFTDWLHISPAPQLMPPFRDLSSSARINLGLQGPENCLHYLYNISDFLGFNKTSPASIIPTPLPPPVIFNSRHRMLSLDSTSTNLINTPSPGPLVPVAPSVAASEHQSQTPQFFSSFSTPLFASSASKMVEDLQTLVSPFANYFSDNVAPPPSFPLEDISPVVRADPFQESLAGPNKLTSGPKKRNKRKQTPSFVQKLRSVPSPEKKLVPSTVDLLDEPIASQRLLSPCKLVSSASNNSRNSPIEDKLVLGIFTSPLSDVSGFISAAPLPHAKTSADCHTSSPLTPLTPLSSSPDPSSHPPLKIVLKIKRKPVEEIPVTPPRRSKRSRRTALVDMWSSPDTEQVFSGPLPESSPEFNSTYSQNRRHSVYTNRKLPPATEISANYPLFYRRFPASRYYQPEGSDSPKDLFGAEHPGGLYNPPRGAFDLYTPRFVKGKGVEKVGLCPICVEPYERGGESKKLWLAMKFSAFNYHMQYSHGISASTGRPFSPPTAFRVVPRPNPGKKEKHLIQQGKCHKCTQWVALEGIKDMESKVKELHWWKHAAACHHDSTLPGEGEYFENDGVFMKLISLNLAHAAT